MRLTKTIAPTLDIVSVVEARSWLAFQDGVHADDDVILNLIDEVIDSVESQTNRRLGTQTWTISLDSSEISDVIRVPLVPLVSVSSIVTTDDDGNETAVGSTNYQVRSGLNPRITLTASGSWPTDCREYDSMLITAVAGYNGNERAYVGFEPKASHEAGTNDMTASIGTWAGTSKTSFEVVIDGELTPDTIKWRKVNRDADGVKTYGSWTAGVTVTGSDQTLADGLSVKFDTTTGHTLGDGWNVDVVEVMPARIRQLLKGLVQFGYKSKGSGILETVSGQMISVPYSLERMIDALRVVPL